jgi:outer membrane protein insertion porin family
MRYALYSTDISIPNTTSQPFNDCSAPIAGITALNPDGTVSLLSCTANGEASIALKESRGTTMTSAPGYTLDYNTVDNLQNPHSGMFAELKQDFAGAGGDSKYVRTVGVAKYYYELYEDVVGVFKVQGGYLWGFGGNNLKITDNFNLGPELVRGFAPSGMGPRDLNGDFKNNPLGGTTYYGGSFEVQFPIWGVPREIGVKGALFADAGALFGYKAAKFFPGFYGGTVANPVNCNPASGSFAQLTPTTVSECVNVHDSNVIRSSVGGSLIWNSPLGPLRFDLAYALTKDKYDRLQVFRFSGGSKF